MALLAVTPLRNHAGSNRISKWSPLGVSDLMRPYIATSGGPHGLAATADDADAEDGPDAANTRADAKAVVARSTAPATNISDLFMTSPFLIDASIVLASRRSSHGRAIGDQWNFAWVTGLQTNARYQQGRLIEPSVEPKVEAAGIEPAAKFSP